MSRNLTTFDKHCESATFSHKFGLHLRLRLGEAACLALGIDVAVVASLLPALLSLLSCGSAGGRAPVIRTDEAGVPSLKKLQQVANSPTFLALECHDWKYDGHGR
ncbi:hypothetical protein PPTG_24466 [Phytophthora nicotianae INRA-310]|uniref:Uncharacterized protein n=1 Tax=Phytophthora nicotianae (strain INRA-310) TaxID=761204 RepID=W2PGR1_PHYN3|nr:hypothetical protein PPTG_24466 [Phytophthora nicotianae INRA-310]ETM99194.1 hypothetical protein PPTG_24466 [Phytophthora nicotianae INRA-310]